MHIFPDRYRAQSFRRGLNLALLGAILIWAGPGSLHLYRLVTVKRLSIPHGPRICQGAPAPPLCPNDRSHWWVRLLSCL